MSSNRIEPWQLVLQEAKSELAQQRVLNEQTTKMHDSLQKRVGIFSWIGLPVAVFIVWVTVYTATSKVTDATIPVVVEKHLESMEWEPRIEAAVSPELIRSHIDEQKLVEAVRARLGKAELEEAVRNVLVGKELGEQLRPAIDDAITELIQRSLDFEEVLTERINARRNELDKVLKSTTPLKVVSNADRRAQLTQILRDVNPDILRLSQISLRIHPFADDFSVKVSVRRKPGNFTSGEFYVDNVVGPHAGNLDRLVGFKASDSGIYSVQNAADGYKIHNESFLYLDSHDSFDEAIESTVEKLSWFIDEIKLPQYPCVLQVKVSEY